MALGMIEVFGFSTAVVTADAAAKAADVKIVALDRNKPANPDAVPVPLVMVVKMEGTAGAVEAAMKAGVEVAQSRGLYLDSDMIAGQSPEIEWFAHLNALGRDKLRGAATAENVEKSEETSVKEI